MQNYGALVQKYTKIHKSPDSRICGSNANCASTKCSSGPTKLSYTSFSKILDVLYNKKMRQFGIAYEIKNPFHERWQKTRSSF